MIVPIFVLKRTESSYFRWPLHCLYRCIGRKWEDFIAIWPLCHGKHLWYGHQGREHKGKITWLITILPELAGLAGLNFIRNSDKIIRQRLWWQSYWRITFSSSTRNLPLCLRRGLLCLTVPVQSSLYFSHVDTGPAGWAANYEEGSRTCWNEKVVSIISCLLTHHSQGSCSVCQSNIDQMMTESSALELTNLSLMWCWGWKLAEVNVCNSKWGSRNT